MLCERAGDDDGRVAVNQTAFTVTLAEWEENARSVVEKSAAARKT